MIAVIVSSRRVDLHIMMMIGSMYYPFYYYYVGTVIVMVDGRCPWWMAGGHPESGSLTDRRKNRIYHETSVFQIMAGSGQLLI